MLGGSGAVTFLFLAVLYLYSRCFLYNCRRILTLMDMNETGKTVAELTFYYKNKRLASFIFDKQETADILPNH